MQALKANPAIPGKKSVGDRHYWVKSDTRELVLDASGSPLTKNDPKPANSHPMLFAGLTDGFKFVPRHQITDEQIKDYVQRLFFELEKSIERIFFDKEIYEAEVSGNSLFAGASMVTRVVENPIKFFEGLAADDFKKLQLALPKIKAIVPRKRILDLRFVVDLVKRFRNKVTKKESSAKEELSFQSGIISMAKDIAKSDSAKDVQEIFLLVSREPHLASALLDRVVNSKLLDQIITVLDSFPPTTFTEKILHKFSKGYEILRGIFFKQAPSDVDKVIEKLKDKSSDPVKVIAESEILPDWLIQIAKIPEVSSLLAKTLPAKSK